MPGRQTRRATIPIPPNQTLHLTNAQPKPFRRLRLPQATLHNRLDHTDTIRLPNAQPHSLLHHPRTPKKGDTLELDKGDISALD